MSTFTAPLVIMPAGGLWSVVFPFTFWSGEEGRGLPIDVPAGFKTDLGSIPRWLWWLLPRDDPRWAGAFVVHDFLCALARFPRIVAASIFLEALGVLARKHSASWWRVWLMFGGVLAWALVRPFGSARAASQLEHTA